MKITKFGHCCLLIEEKSARILTDPGKYSSGQDKLTGLDAILITHDHEDHLSIGSLKKILKNNREIKIFTNRQVGKTLEKEKIKFTILEGGQMLFVKDVLVEGFGTHHQAIHESLSAGLNTGYMIGNKFFYPGDAFTVLSQPVEILALPVAGPWLKLSEAIDYALTVRPKVCFPVHDGILKSVGTTSRIPATILGPNEVEFIHMEIEKEYEL